MRAKTSQALDAWLASLTTKAHGFTATEIADRLGCSRMHANTLIGRGVREGRIRYVGKVERSNVCGGMHKVPGYELV